MCKRFGDGQSFGQSLSLSQLDQVVDDGAPSGTALHSALVRSNFIPWMTMLGGAAGVDSSQHCQPHTVSHLQVFPAKMRQKDIKKQPQAQILSAAPTIFWNGCRRVGGDGGGYGGVRGWRRAPPSAVVWWWCPRPSLLRGGAIYATTTHTHTSNLAQRASG